MIRAYLRGQQNQWDLNLGCLAGAYRATVHEATHLTPNMMMLGREVRIPHEVVFGSTVQGNKFERVTQYGEYVSGLRNQMQKSHAVARQHLAKTAEQQEVRYDIKARGEAYSRGDLVWMKNESREVGVCPKLQVAFLGPFVVTQVRGFLNFEIQMNDAGKTKVLHFDKLKRYQGVHPPAWAVKVAEALNQSITPRGDVGTQTETQ